VSDNTKFGPPKGMRDWLPREILLRQKLIRLIERHYQLYGFQPIDTPALENIEVLQGKGGGENEKLMFEISKRAEDFFASLGKVIVTKPKLFRDLAIQQGTEPKPEAESPEKNAALRSEAIEVRKEIVDMGLRFDLTVPLARYVSNHWNDLPKPFRCYHVGPVWRADRPQKGRFREFYQCDIDIVGGASDDYEVELLLATDRVLKELNLGKFKIRVSHKQLLPDLLSGMGIDASQHPKIALSIDKLDKQPLAEVKKELSALSLSPEGSARLFSFLDEATGGLLDVKRYSGGGVEPLWRMIEGIQKKVHEINREANVVFDPLLVRGFDYYTGPVFEINVEDKNFTFSIGGGGRYDGLIEKLGGPKGTTAVGVSLGFERILTILMERDPSATAVVYPRVFIANNGQSEKEIQALAENLRSRGLQVETCLEKKDFVKQMKMAQENGIEYAITKFTPGGDKFVVRRLSTRQDEDMSLAKLEDAVKKLATEPQR
jgi:histidyl-tRNA synthetase